MTFPFPIYPVLVPFLSPIRGKCGRGSVLHIVSTKDSPLSIMRHSFYSSNPQTRRNAPYKRRTVPQLPTPSRSNPSAVIDQRLVEGAQQEPLFNRLPREGSSSDQPKLQLFSRDENLELDAFGMPLNYPTVTSKNA